MNKGLLKDFTVRPLICLPLNLDRLIPAPLVIDKFSVFGLIEIKLVELIALVVGRDIKGRKGILPTDDKGTLNDRVIFNAVDRGAAKDVFPRTFEAGEESTWREKFSISHQQQKT